MSPTHFGKYSLNKHSMSSFSIEFLGAVVSNPFSLLSLNCPVRTKLAWVKICHSLSRRIFCKAVHVGDSSNQISNWSDQSSCTLFLLLRAQCYRIALKWLLGLQLATPRSLGIVDSHVTSLNKGEKKVKSQIKNCDDLRTRSMCHLFTFDTGLLLAEVHVASLLTLCKGQWESWQSVTSLQHSSSRFFSFFYIKFKHELNNFLHVLSVIITFLIVQGWVCHLSWKDWWSRRAIPQRRWKGEF